MAALNRIDSILCVVDPTIRSGGAAVARAAAVALKFGASLELFICQVPLSSPDDDAILSRRLDELAVPCRCYLVRLCEAPVLLLAS